MSVFTPADLSKMKHESGAAESDVCGAEQVEKNKADVGFSRRNKEELLQEIECREIIRLKEVMQTFSCLVL